MNQREELVALIASGTTPREIFEYFTRSGHLSRPAIIRLLADSGVSLQLPPSEDEISDDRRRFLQELSLT